MWGKAKIAVFSVIIIVLAVIYMVFDPSTNSFFPKCPIYAATGIPCPGCGTQRAINSILHLDFAGAWKYNAMLIVSLPVLLILTFTSASRNKYPKLYRYTHGTVPIYIISAAFLLWWILRIMFGWYVV